MTKSAKKPGGQRIKVLWNEKGVGSTIPIRRLSEVTPTPPWWIPRKPGQTGPSRPYLYLEGL